MSRTDYTENSNLSFAVEGPVLNLFFYNDQFLERNGRQAGEIDRYDFALSGWSLEPDHQRLWYYPLNINAILNLDSNSGVLVQGLPGGFSVVTIESLAGGDPLGKHFDLAEPPNEIDVNEKTAALIVGNEIQIWQPE